MNANNNQTIRIRRCSYCGMQEHNISTCNHASIHKLRKSCFGNRLIFDFDNNNNNNNNRSKEKFSEWIFKVITEDQQLVLVFGSRFCRIPSHVDFITRAEGITRYVYHYSHDEVLQIVNPRNDYIINLVLSNTRTFSGMLFDERVDYLNRIILYLGTSQEQSNSQTPKKYDIQITVSLGNTSNHEEKEDKEDKEDNEERIIIECPICYEEKSKECCVDFMCNHSFCGDCFISTLEKSTKKEPSCPLCRETVKQITLYNEDIINRITPYIETKI